MVKSISKQKSFKDNIMYCCHCMCTNCLKITSPPIETKVCDSITVSFDGPDIICEKQVVKQLKKH